MGVGKWADGGLVANQAVDRIDEAGNADHTNKLSGFGVTAPALVDSIINNSVNSPEKISPAIVIKRLD